MSDKKKNNKKTSVQITEEFHSELKVICEQRGYKLSSLIENLAKSALSSSKKDGK